MTAAPELFYSLILAALGGVICVFVCNKRESIVPLLIFFELSYWMRWAIAYLNDIVQFWPQKDLSDMSLSMIDQPGGIWALVFSKLNGLAANTSGLGNVKFFIEALINLPALRLLEESITTLILTDCFIGAIIGVVVFAYLTRMFDKRIATVGFLLVSLYPCAVNFSIFAPRDLFLYSFTLIMLMSFTWLILRKDRRITQGIIYTVSLFCVLFLRLALFPFAMMLPGWLFLYWARKTFMRFPSTEEKMFIIAVACIVVPLMTAAAGYIGYTVVLRQIGYSELISPDELLQQYTMNRYSRGFQKDSQGNGQVLVAGSGNGSDVLPPGLYKSVPLPVRLAVQVIGMWMVPMPWLLTSLARILGFADSLFVATVMFWAFRAQTLFKFDGVGRQTHQWQAVQKYSLSVQRAIGFAELFTFMSLMICFGMLVSNSGDAFRMRLCVVPYVIPSASIYFSATYSFIEGRFVRTAIDSLVRRRKQYEKRRRGRRRPLPVPGAVTANISTTT